MRKFYWCCVAIALAVVAAVYVAAQHAGQHPDSILARCALYVYRLGVDYNPISALSHAIAARVSSSAPSLADAAVPPSCASPGLPPLAPCAEDTPPASSQASDITVRQDLLNLLQAQVAHHLNTCMEPGHELAKGGPAGLISINSETHASPSEGCPETMPCCQEDDADPPATMPYTQDTRPAEAANSISDFWTGFFLDESSMGKNQCHMKTAPGAASQEESEIMHLGNPPNCQEDPQSHYQYPGCPYMGPCPSPRAQPAPITKPEAEPTIHPLLKDSEILPKAKHSACKPIHLPANCPDCEKCPVHPEVDTMEFRPSDARPGEFEQHPK